MPPRHHYWTIIFGNQPTSFRAATQEELLPTFRQIQSKHPDAVMMWFASGRLWRSEEEFRAARFKRREDRPGPPPAFARKPSTPGYGEAPPKDREGGDWKSRGPKPAWRDRPRDARGPRPPHSGEGGRPEGRDRGGKPQWRDRPRDPRDQPGPPPASSKPWSGAGGKPHGGGGGKPAFARKPFKPGYGEARPKQHEGGDWKARGPKPAWKDRPRDPRDQRPPAFARKPFKPGYGEAPPKHREGGEWKNRPPRPREGGDWKDRPRDQRGQAGPPSAKPLAKPKPRTGEGWKPRSGEGGEPRQKDRWRDRPAPPPGAEAKRGRDWRPGGQHKDPRDRFKVPRDVKRARFKDKLRRDRMHPKPPKKKDEE